ncbi:hypothetical protein Agub_g1664, partial [Astrephomene gubernaculifera]
WPVGQELTELLLAFARLQLYSEPLLEAAADLLCAPTSSTSTSSSPLGVSLLTPLQAVQIAAAFSQLRHFHPTLLRLLATRLTSVLPSLPPRLLAGALCAFATLNYCHPPLVRAAAGRTRQLLLGLLGLQEQEQHRREGAAGAAGTAAMSSAAEGTRSGTRPVTSGGTGTRANATTSKAWEAGAAAAAAGSQEGDSAGGGEGGGEGAGALLAASEVVTLLWSFGVLQQGGEEGLVAGLMRALPRDPASFTPDDLSRLGLAEALWRTRRPLRGQQLPQPLQQQPAGDPASSPPQPPRQPPPA